MTTLNRLPVEERKRRWLTLARRALYRPATLAALCGICIRQLERYFAADFDTTPTEWLRAQRMHDARILLRNAGSIKEVAYALGFKHPSHFCREFRESFGECASRLVQA